MSKIIFNYGVMNASKTTQLLQVNHNYLLKNQHPILIKPSLDTRSITIKSRIGIEAKADIIIEKNKFTKDILYNHYIENNKPEAILVDEAQFISIDDINIIVSFARQYKMSVFAYGLLKDFKNRLFPGSAHWIEESDNLNEIKTECRYCERKATINARLINNKIVKDGPLVVIGAEESYVSVCRYHYDNLD